VYIQQRNVLKQFVLLILIFCLSILNAEEFILENTIIKSKVIEKTVTCNTFNIKLESEQFPFKHERKIPHKFKIDNYYGADNLIRREAFLMPQKLKILFPKNIKESVLKERTYLPYNALCKKNKLVIFYSSGGNCNGCEVFIEFDVVKAKPVNPTKVNYRKIKDFYK